MNINIVDTHNHSKVMKESSHQFSSFSLKQRLASLRNISQQDANGFTLVELIVVIMMIGILSSIAIPQFMSAANKAKQKEATSIVGSALRAAAAYNTEYGSMPSTIPALTEYARFQACVATGITDATTGGAAACKNKTPDLAKGTGANQTSTTWYSPSGNYLCTIATENKTVSSVVKNMFQITCDPYGPTYAGDGGSVQGCYNGSDSTNLVKEWKLNDSEKGPQLSDGAEKQLDCSTPGA